MASVQKIHFCVHGICDPGYEIRDELVRVLSNKLDDAVFEQLNLLIARNPKCRLAPADVQVIQLIRMLFFVYLGTFLFGKALCINSPLKM